MDKRKYQTKTLIAQYEDLCKIHDFRYTETAYRLKNGSIIIEFEGKGMSPYGVRIGFCKYIPRKGVFSIEVSEYEIWKDIRKKQEEGYLIEWENDIDEIMNKDHENVLKCVGEDELPF